MNKRLNGVDVPLYGFRYIKLCIFNEQKYTHTHTINRVLSDPLEDLLRVRLIARAKRQNSLIALNLKHRTAQHLLVVFSFFFETVYLIRLLILLVKPYTNHSQTFKAARYALLRAWCLLVRVPGGLTTPNHFPVHNEPNTALQIDFPFFYHNHQFSFHDHLDPLQLIDRSQAIAFVYHTRILYVSVQDSITYDKKKTILPTVVPYYT